MLQELLPVGRVVSRAQDGSGYHFIEVSFDKKNADAAVSAWSREEGRHAEITGPRARNFKQAPEYDVEFVWWW